jgi:hypothetical protein
MAFSKREQSFCFGIRKNLVRWTITKMSAVLPNVDILSIPEIYNANWESFSLYRRKNYRELLRSVFIANFLNVSRTYE